MSSIVLKPVIPVQWNFCEKSEMVLQMFIQLKHPATTLQSEKATTNIMTLTIIYSFGWFCTHLMRFFIGIQSKKVVHRAT